MTQMPRGRLTLLALLALATPACREPEVIPVLTTMRLHTPIDEVCDAPPVGEGVAIPLRVEALGDFPLTDRTVRPLDEMEAVMAQEYDSFPDDTRIFSVRSADPGWEAGGISLLDAPPLADERHLLLLPFGQPCPLSEAPDVDGEAAPDAPEGSALVALPDGSLLIAGGKGPGDLPIRRVIRLGAG